MSEVGVLCLKSHDSLNDSIIISFVIQSYKMCTTCTVYNAGMVIISVVPIILKIDWVVIKRVTFQQR